MKLRIFSDGTVFGTSVETRNGEQIEGVTEILYHHIAGDLPRIEMKLATPLEMNVKGECSAETQTLRLVKK